MKTNNSDSNVFELNDTLWPIVRVATHNTVLDPIKFEEEYGEEECQCACEKSLWNSHKDNPFRYFRVDHEKWNNELLKLTSDFINENVIEKMKPYGVESIQVHSIHSPEFFDYWRDDNDELRFSVVMSSDFRKRMDLYLNKFRESDDEKYSSYIEEHFHTYHLYSQIEDFKNPEICIGAYLTLCLVDMDMSDVAEDFIEYAHDWLCNNSTAGAVRNILLEYTGVDIDSNNEDFSFEECFNDFLELYNDDFAIWKLYHDLWEHIGLVWRGYDALECLENGNKSINHCIVAKNDAMRMIFWAIDNDYSLEDLKAMAA